MKLQARVALRALCAVAWLSGCGSTDKMPAGGAGTGAGGTGGNAGGGAADNEALNPNCPSYIGPFDGPYAQRGECCRRTKNSTALAADPSSTMATIEYRLNLVQTVNHPTTLGLQTIKTLNIIRVEDEQQSLLWRFNVPSAGGKLVSGPGTFTVGVGRYNCDGTYSYYSKTAAPARPESSNDPARWLPHEVPITVDVTKPVPDRFKLSWAKNENRGYTVTPYLNTSTFAMDWELWDQGFSIEKMPTDDAALDCIGSRTDNNLWKTGGSFVVYTQLDKNDHDPISSLAEQTLCQLLAFGVVVDKDSDKNSCSKTARCMPGAAGCTWLKLPDSLCPGTPDEQSKWGCHIGDANNVDKEKANCTATAPTAALDPDQGATSEGQCCDPLGKGTGGLPACNAYMLRNEFVAAAAKITADPANELQTNCNTMK